MDNRAGSSITTDNTDTNVYVRFSTCGAILLAYGLSAENRLSFSACRYEHRDGVAEQFVDGCRRFTLDDGPTTSFDEMEFW